MSSYTLRLSSSFSVGQLPDDGRVHRYVDLLVTGSDRTSRECRAVRFTKPLDLYMYTSNLYVRKLVSNSDFVYLYNLGLLAEAWIVTGDSVSVVREAKNLLQSRDL